MSAPVKRSIYLNGVDMGLSAWSRNDAVSQIFRVLLARGHFSVTPEVLDQTYKTEKGRVDFAWPVGGEA